MAKKIAIIYFCFHFLLGALLPNNDFSFVIEIPKIYQSFQEINGETDFSEFLEEQFFDWDKALNLEDEHEKEQIPVSFHYNFTSFILYEFSIPHFSFSNFIAFIEKRQLIFDENIIENFLGDIFHPPRH